MQMIPKAVSGAYCRSTLLEAALHPLQPRASAHVVESSQYASALGKAPAVSPENLSQTASREEWCR